MKYFILQTPGEIRLVTASDTIDGKLNLQMNGFRTTSGILETWEKDEKMSVGFLERLLKHGYISITYDKDLKEYGFNFELTCAMLRKGQTIFKSI